MNWYLAKIVYQIICGDGQHTAQFDEQLRAITASCEEEAFDKALHIGKGEEEVFYNQKQQLVQWRFINVSELYLLNTLIDGAELYSHITEADDSDSYIALVNHKADCLQQKITHSQLHLI